MIQVWFGLVAKSWKLEPTGASRLFLSPAFQSSSNAYCWQNLTGGQLAKSDVICIIPALASQNRQNIEGWFSGWDNSLIKLHRCYHQTTCDESFSVRHTLRILEWRAQFLSKITPLIYKVTLMQSSVYPWQFRFGICLLLGQSQAMWTLLWFKKTKPYYSLKTNSDYFDFQEMN